MVKWRPIVAAVVAVTALASCSRGAGDDTAAPAARLEASEQRLARIGEWSEAAGVRVRVDAAYRDDKCDPSGRALYVVAEVVNVAAPGPAPVSLADPSAWVLELGDGGTHSATTRRWDWPGCEPPNLGRPPSSGGTWLYRGDDARVVIAFVIDWRNIEYASVLELSFRPSERSPDFITVDLSS